MANSKKEQEIDFKIERVMYQKELNFLEKEAAILLANILKQEDYLSYTKRNRKLDPDDINDMLTLIVEFLNYLSLIDAYSLFQKKNQPLLNIDSFMSVVDKCFSARLNQFVFYFFSV